MKKNIVIIGAGRSATVLIEYLNRQALLHNWSITVADADFSLAQQKTYGLEACSPAALDVMDAQARQTLLAKNDLVISMLPAALHIKVAEDCLALSKHLLTASYISPQIAALDEAVRAKGLVFMNELGLDPGIDHLSAVQKIHEIKAQGGKITGFYSSTGGLVAPESDTNPWHYKFSWNPRNVVVAGQGVAQYLEQGNMLYIPYRRLFQQIRTIAVPGMGDWEVYANRDSLGYIKAYGLEEASTVFRGTIRHRGYCSAWDALVQLGYTESAFAIPNSENMTLAELTAALIGPGSLKTPLKKRVAKLLRVAENGPIMDNLDWLGVFSDQRCGVAQATPAGILEHILLEKWALEPGDKDMVIMQHIFEYKLHGKKKKLTSSLILLGDDSIHTAMAKTVGLPLGIFAKLLLLGHKMPTGVLMPVMPEVYTPVLAELAELGIKFVETEG